LHIPAQRIAAIRERRVEPSSQTQHITNEKEVNAMTNLQNIELARSIERRRVFCAEHECSNRTVLHRVTTMLNTLSDRRDRS
jgi:hypothetical protein